MRKGKEKCEILKALRKDIAAKNNIPFEPNVCTHQGECRGTCPACESEVKYLERMLSRIESTGKEPQLVGISACLAAMVPVALGCSGNTPKAPNMAASPLPISQEAQSTDAITMTTYDSEQENDILVGRSVPVDTLIAPQKKDAETTDEGDVETAAIEVLEEVGLALEIPMVGEVAPEDEEIPEEPIPFQLVENKPDFDGGITNFPKWVKDNLDSVKYNEAFSECRGRIMIQCTIEEDGTLTNAKILRGIDPALDQMVIDVVVSSPCWIPGTQNGKPVRVSINLPIIFP